MATTATIERADDPRVADYLAMTDAERSRRRGAVLCEGRLAVERAVTAGATLRSVLVSPARASVVAAIVADREVPVYVAPQPLLDEIAGFPLHRGIVASVERPPERDATALLDGARTVALVEGVNDHENLGVLFRNAAAFGIDAVLLDPRCPDPLYRRTIRVSLGHVLAVPFARVPALPAGLDGLRAAGFTLAALTPAGEVAVEELRELERVCVLLGNEGDGLTAAALAAADIRVRIPMRAGIDSLNVATAAALAFHHRFEP